MRKVIWIALLTVLWGCGPEQTSAERDQAQVKKLADMQREQCARWVGGYRGTVTYSGDTPGSDISYEVSLLLNPINTLSSDVSRGTYTEQPSLNGTYRQCLQKGCLDNSLTANDAVKVIQLANANCVGNLQISSPPPTGTCSSNGSPDCSQISYEFKLVPGGLVGKMKYGTGAFSALSLTKVQ